MVNQQLSHNQQNKEISFSASMSLATQHALVGYALSHEEFFHKCKEYIDPNWLDDIYLINILDQLIKFYKEFKVLPRSDMELLNAPFFRSQHPDEIKRYFEVANSCRGYCSKYTLSVIREIASRFVKTIQAKNLAKNLVVNINKNNFDNAASAAEKIAAIWRNPIFEPPQVIDFSDTISMWLKDDVEKQKISTGCKSLDEMLGGGLEPGGNLAVLAPTFTGKSRFLLSLARHLLVQRKKVLYIFHEDSPARVKERLISALIGVGAPEISYLMKEKYKDIFDPQKNLKAVEELNKLQWENPNLTLEEWVDLRVLIYSQLDLARQILSDHIVFLPWQKAGRMFVEDVLIEIRRLNSEEIAKNGKGFDVIIDDYPALLRSKERHEHERARLSYVYQCFNDIAAEIGACCAYAVQVNRQAAKAMKKGEAEYAIGLEDVSESYQIAMNAMAAISLNRSGDDASAKILRIAVVKARDSQAQGLMITRTDYHHGSIYGDAHMYQELGKFLIKGLKNYIVAGHDISSTDIINKALMELEDKISQADLVLRSQSPSVLKKLLNLDITKLMEKANESASEVKLESQSIKNDSQNVESSSNIEQVCNLPKDSVELQSEQNKNEG